MENYYYIVPGWDNSGYGSMFDYRVRKMNSNQNIYISLDVMRWPGCKWEVMI